MEINKCRLCQITREDLNLPSKKLIKYIFQYTQININENENLLKKICIICSSTIENFHQFRELVQRVDAKLKAEIKNYKQCNSSDKINLTNEINHNQTHLITNSKEKQCEDDVGKEYNFQDFEIHNVTEEHTKSCRSYKCIVCNEEFVRKKHLLHHQKKYDDKFPCTWENCNAICKSAYALKMHLMRHEGEKPYLCVTCGKSFAARNSLYIHEKIHSEIKAFKCKICDMSFSINSNLKAHERNHHEGVRFYCSQCTKNFSTKVSLDRHERVHIGIKEFQCENCPSSFYTKKELIKHQIYHKGIKHYKCGECYKSFFEKHHLTIHKRSHSGEKPFKCELTGCDKAFTESQKLSRHMKTRHANIT